MTVSTESAVQAATVSWLERIGWQVAHGPDIAPNVPASEHRDDGDLALSARIADAPVTNARSAF
jgi:type I restriction enzyme R subunit